MRSEGEQTADTLELPNWPTEEELAAAGLEDQVLDSQSRTVPMAEMRSDEGPAAETIEMPNWPSEVDFESALSLVDDLAEHEAASTGSPPESDDVPWEELQSALDDFQSQLASATDRTQD